LLPDIYLLNMEQSVAVNLIRKGIPETNTPQIWADLGAGSGVFTLALASILPENSVIHAVDKSDVVSKISSPDSRVKISTIQLDFVSQKMSLPQADGFLLANSLHFVREKKLLIREIASKLSGSGRIIIVEYDLKIPNQWVPFPIPFIALSKLANDCGARNIQKIGEVPSAYNQSNIYASVLSFS
jgi:trans-aconitate methyltransferase